MNLKEWGVALVLVYLIFGVLGCEQVFWLILVLVGLYFSLKTIGVVLFCVLSAIIVPLGLMPKTQKGGEKWKKILANRGRKSARKIGKASK